MPTTTTRLETFCAWLQVQPDYRIVAEQTTPAYVSRMGGSARAIPPAHPWEPALPWQISTLLDRYRRTHPEEA